MINPGQSVPGHHEERRGAAKADTKRGYGQPEHIHTALISIPRDALCGTGQQRGERQADIWEFTESVKPLLPWKNLQG